MATATELVQQLTDGTRTAYAPDVEDFISLVFITDEYFGYDNMATIHGEEVICEIQTSSDEEIQVAGGRADKGFSKIRVAIPLFTDPPRQGDSATILASTHASYVSAEVLKIVERTGNIWTLMIGEQAAMDTRTRNIR